MSHHGHEEHLERQEENRLEELEEEEKRLAELSQLQQDHEFLEKVYATVIDSAERKKLIIKHFYGEDK